MIGWARGAQGRAFDLAGPAGLRLLLALCASSCRLPAAAADDPASLRAPAPPAPAAAAWIDGDAARVLRAIDASPASARDRAAQLNRAVAQLQAGQREAAEAALEALRARHPRWTPATRWLARAKRELGRPDTARAIAALLALDAGSRDFLWAGQFHADQRDLARARDCWARAVRLEPDLYFGWLWLGDARAALGDLAAAREAWGRARELHEGGDVLLRLGRSLLDEDRRADATTLFEAALRAPEAEEVAPEIRRLVPGLASPEPAGAGLSLPLRPGERLRYRAKFLLFHIATLEVADLERSLYRGRWAHRVELRVASSPDFPWLKIDSRFESRIADDGTVLAHRNLGVDASTRHASAYEMDPEARTCEVRRVVDGLFEYERLPLPRLAQDGVSVALLARALARRGGALSVLTTADAAWKGTLLRTVGRETIRRGDARVSAVRVESIGHYRAPAGLAGTVTLWVSDDERALPLRSKMNVGLGSVTLELMDAASELAAAGPPRAGRRRYCLW